MFWHNVLHEVCSCAHNVSSQWHKIQMFSKYCFNILDNHKRARKQKHDISHHRYTFICLLFLHLCISPSYIRSNSPGAARFWTWAGTWTLASEAKVRRPPLPMRSHSRVMCFLRRAVSWGRPSTGPPVWARDVAWSLGLRDKQLRRRWETAASQLSSQPWGDRNVRWNVKCGKLSTVLHQNNGQMEQLRFLFYLSINLGFLL